MVHCIWLYALESFLLANIATGYVQYAIGGYTFTLGEANSQLSQHDASTWCNANGTQLLSILNGDTQNRVVNFLNDFYSKGLINGWNTLTNAKRGGRGWQWISDKPTGNINIENQGPDLSKSFGFLQNSGTAFAIVASIPTEKRSFICEGESFCSDGQLLNNRCFKYFTELLSWFDARNRCIDGGGDLASFDFISDSPGLAVLNRTWLPSKNSYWIGIKRLLWKWQNLDVEMKYSQWLDGQPIYDPSDDCICLRPYTWKWLPCDCSEKIQFVCLSITNISTAKSTTSTSVSTSTSTSRTTTKTTTTTTTVIFPTRSTNKTTEISLSTPNSMRTATSHESSGSQSSSVLSTVLLIDQQRSSKYRSHPTYNDALGIGLGVGIGGGVLISAILVGCYIRALRRGWSGTFPHEKVAHFSQTNHRPSSYALIQRKSSELSQSSATMSTTVGSSNSNSNHQTPGNFYNGSTAVSGSAPTLLYAFDHPLENSTSTHQPQY